jgi:hypothetical protein
MAKKENCVKCQRLMSIKAKGLCGKCYAEQKDASNDLPGSVEATPAEAKTVMAIQAAVPTVGLAGRQLVIYFDPEDFDIYDELAVMAKRDRRDVSQQALYLLEKACTVE